MRKWRKSQLQAFIDKYGLPGGPTLFWLLKRHAAQARAKAVRARRPASLTPA